MKSGAPVTGIDQRRPALRAVLADRAEEERAPRLVLDLEPGNGRAGELAAVEAVEPEHGAASSATRTVGAGRRLEPRR